MLNRTPLLLEYSAVVDRNLMKNGGIYNRNQRKDILNKWKGHGTSEGTKSQGFGVPHSGRRLRRTRRAGGELLTDKKAPNAIELMRRKSANRKDARGQSSYLGASRIERLPLLLDHHGENT